MRGSPLLRSLLVLVGLVASAVGLVGLTKEGPATAQTMVADASAVATTPPIRYRLVLSAEAEEVSIGVDDQPLQSTLEGSLLPTSKHPVIFLKVRWKNTESSDAHRFAKLTLEPHGQPTLTHVFDASGDIDDLFELP